jgi:hypothetical protein
MFILFYRILLSFIQQIQEAQVLLNQSPRVVTELTDYVKSNFISQCSGENWNRTPSTLFALQIMISARWEIKNDDQVFSGHHDIQLNYLK